MKEEEEIALLEHQGNTSIPNKEQEIDESTW